MALGNGEAGKLAPVFGGEDQRDRERDDDGAGDPQESELTAHWHNSTGGSREVSQGKDGAGEQVLRKYGGEAGQTEERQEEGPPS